MKLQPYYCLTMLLLWSCYSVSTAHISADKTTVWFYYTMPPEHSQGANGAIIREGRQGKAMKSVRGAFSAEKAHAALYEASPHHTVERS